MEYVGREEHTEFAKRIEDEQHRQNRRIELLEESVKQNTALTVSVEKLANNMESMANEQAKQGERLEALEGRDGEMWRTVVKYVLTAALNADWIRIRRKNMEQIINYVKPELIVVAIVLYFIGMAIKQSETIADKYIPSILGIAGIVICGIYVIATCTLGTGQDIAMAMFTAIVQGILVAGLSNYVNQLIKQSGKEE